MTNDDDASGPSTSDSLALFGDPSQALFNGTGSLALVPTEPRATTGGRHRVSDLAAAGGVGIGLHSSPTL